MKPNRILVFSLAAEGFGVSAQIGSGWFGAGHQGSTKFFGVRALNGAPHAVKLPRKQHAQVWAAHIAVGLGSTNPPFKLGLGKRKGREGGQGRPPSDQRRQLCPGKVQHARRRLRQATKTSWHHRGTSIANHWACARSSSFCSRVCCARARLRPVVALPTTRRTSQRTRPTQRLDEATRAGSDCLVSPLRGARCRVDPLYRSTVAHNCVSGLLSRLREAATQSVDLWWESDGLQRPPASSDSLQGEALRRGTQWPLRPLRSTARVHFGRRRGVFRAPRHAAP